MPTKSEHGTRTRYVAGCRCDECGRANTVYQQKLKNRKRSASLTALPGTPGRPSVTVPSRDDDEEVGSTEADVIRELSMLSAAQKQPGLTAAIRQMARILDAPDLATTQPSAMRQMVQGLDKLRAASAGRSGKLASVASMSQRSAATADAS